MSSEFFKKVNELTLSEVPFATATVIKTTGSVSAKTGSKSIINRHGETLFGWVGGGCAESAVCEAAMESQKDGETRIVSLDLDDEVLGVGMPCGGTMEVYVEPFLPKPELLIVGHGRIAEMLASLGHSLHFRISVNDPSATRENFPFAHKLINSDPDYQQMQVNFNTYVVVVTQHKGDHHSIKKALEGNGRYIGLVASIKRSRLVFEYLADEGVNNETLKRVHAPCGLDLGGTSPEEIALSIICEMVKIRNQGSGLPMMQLKHCSP